MLRAFPTAVIENLQPLVDGGRYPVKRVVGDDLAVEADVFKDGHDVVAAALKWRLLGETQWHETPMAHVDNDRWRGVCTVYENTTYEYTVEAWTDTFRGWQHEFAAKFEAGIANLRSETLEGAALLDEAANRADDAADAARLRELADDDSGGRARADQRDRAFRRTRSPDGDLSRPRRRHAIRARAPRLSSIERRRERPPGMNSFRAPRKVTAIAAQPFAIACRASTTRRRWDST